jgi:hypothetical protein
MGHAGTRPRSRDWAAGWVALVAAAPALVIRGKRATVPVERVTPRGRRSTATPAVRVGIDAFIS